MMLAPARRCGRSIRRFRREGSRASAGRVRSMLQPSASLAAIFSSISRVPRIGAGDDIVEEDLLGLGIGRVLDRRAEPMIVELMEQLRQRRAFHFHLVERLHGGEPRGRAGLRAGLVDIARRLSLNRRSGKPTCRSLATWRRAVPRRAAQDRWLSRAAFDPAAVERSPFPDRRRQPGSPTPTAPMASGVGWASQAQTLAMANIDQTNDVGQRVNHGCPPVTSLEDHRPGQEQCRSAQRHYMKARCSGRVGWSSSNSSATAVTTIPATIGRWL